VSPPKRSGPPRRQHEGTATTQTAAESPASAKTTSRSKPKHRRQPDPDDARYPRSFRAWDALLRERPFGGGWTW
jgi:hypothetical protein